MVRTPLDKLDGDGRPLPIQVGCAICGKPLLAKWHWLFSRWIHATVHDACAEAWEKNSARRYGKVIEQEIPARFAQFDSGRADPRALRACGAFSPQSELHTLALIGERATGKSRLMWATVQSFFSDLERLTGSRSWVNYFLFTDLAFEPEKSMLIKAKTAQYVFIDDVGATDSYGRDRAQLQDIIRSRVQLGRWTFLTIDNPDFDPGFNDVFRDRAIVVYTE